MEQPPPPITGTHGATIETLGVAREGDAAVTADRRGGLRVWPTLDGSREPFVIHAQRPGVLAIAHDRDGFLIGNIDAARGLELIQVDRDGRLRTRASVRGEAVQDLVLSDGAAIVLRADQTIERLAPTGERTAALIPDAGTRVLRLLAAKDRVLAVGERGKKELVRWIEPGARAWGATVSTINFAAIEAVAVSPDGEYLLANRAGAKIISLATGRQGPPVCGEKHSTTSVALGFIDDDTVACLVENKLVWWSIGGKVGIGVETPSFSPDRVRDIGRGLIVTAEGRDLVLHRVDGAKQLGYAMTHNAVMRFAPGGITIAGVHRSILVDATLRMRRAIDHPLDEELLPIGDGFAVGISSPEVSLDDAWGESHAISVFDLAKGATHQNLGVRTSSALAFERSTGLLAAIDGAHVHLVRYDPKTHVFGSPIAVTGEQVIHRIVLFDPVLSRGLVAMTVQERAVGAIIGEIEASDLDGKQVKVRRRHTIEGELLAIDRAGRIYSHDKYGRVHVQSRLLGSHDVAIGARSLVPDADGSRLAVMVGSEVSLYLADGTRVWTVPVRDVRQLRWVGNDLVAAFSNALARFDLVTGELVARQCGWDFGLRDVKNTSGGGDALNVCDAE